MYISHKVVSSLKKIQYSETNDLANKTKYLKYNRVMVLAMAGTMAAMGYVNYQIVQSIPTSTLEDN